MTAGLAVRPFVKSDVPALLSMMKGLARFEGYIDEFRVTARDLVEQGLGDSSCFGAFVAEQEGVLMGYAVHYRVPFTYRMRPTLVLKELYVRTEGRGNGVGGALFEAVKAEAKRIDAGALDWLVLPGNDKAKSFYQAHGGKQDTGWERWYLDQS